ncbi:MAG: tripartite tricarboxylate transporter substrate binding protein [Rubritepida sp.]|nr:tripartite tricarboxylate transporter substrate binding protein [Rubritepida sp.]
MLALPALAAAQPGRPIRIVVPFPPGGPTDIAARLIADGMAPLLGQPVITDNRPGAAGNLAAEHVARAVPDGTTLLFSGSGSHGINPALFAGRLSFDAVRDFAPVVLVSSAPNLLSAGRQGPADLAALIAAARARPGALNIAVGSLGTTQHMAVELLKLRAGIDVTIIPYRGAAQALQDLMAGTVDALSDGLMASLPHAREGRIRALGVTSPARSPAAPEIPSIAETLPGFTAVAWFGLHAPAGTPREVVLRLNAAANQAMANPALRARYADAGSVLLGGTPEDAGTHIGREIATWAEVVRATGARPE